MPVDETRVAQVRGPRFVVVGAAGCVGLL